MLRVLGVGEQRELFGRERAAPAGTCQHLGDEAATRMRDQVQSGTGR